MSANVTFYDFKAGFKQEIEVLDPANLSESNREKLLEAHRAGFYLIIYFGEGPREHQVDFKNFTVPKNAFLFVNKGQVHRFDKASVFKGRMILFTESFFYRQDENLNFLRRLQLFNDFLEPAILATDKEESPLKEYFDRVEQEYTEEEKDFHFDLLHNHLCNFLMLAERERRKTITFSKSQGDDQQYLLLFRESVNAFFKERRTVSQYASDLNISEKRLTQATTNNAGKTPKQLINERVLLEAKRLMVYKLDTVKEIGYQLGFDEPTNFIKYFRKHEGCTPKDFRQKINA